jgi:carbamoyltransferase
MLLVAPVQPSKRHKLNGEAEGKFGIDRLKVLRSVVPAVTHVDYSARIQTVNAHRHGRYYKLLEAFRKKTGCPVLINTSFNVRGEPIVGSPADAYRCFLATNIDALVLEDFVLLKGDQQAMSDAEAKKYLAQFQLD